MMSYEKRVLEGLVDNYENSCLYTGDNKVSVRIFYRFTKKNMPEYFDESSLAFESIHAAMERLQDAGYLVIIWKGKKKGHIIDKVALREEMLSAVYQYLKREPKAEREKRNLQMLQQLQQIWKTPAAAAFLKNMQERIQNHLPVKEYLDLNDMERTKLLVKAVACVETNSREIFIREFSVRHFADSKIFEALLGMVARILRETFSEFEEMDAWEILAEYQIYHTPNYVYVKGHCVLDLQECGRLDLSQMKNGVALPGEVISRIHLERTERVSKVITIENLTTFFRWQEPEGVLLYLGGYHNQVRQQFLLHLYEQLPGVQWLHFGDIDCGGFQIFENLRRKTGILFQTVFMDVETLKRYEAYGRTLTAGDRKRLEDMLEQESAEYQAVLEYMLEHNVKLEQECVELEKENTF